MTSLDRLLDGIWATAAHEVQLSQRAQGACWYLDESRDWCCRWLEGSRTSLGHTEHRMRAMRGVQARKRERGCAGTDLVLHADIRTRTRQSLHGHGVAPVTQRPIISTHHEMLGSAGRSKYIRAACMIAVLPSASVILMLALLQLLSSRNCATCSAFLSAAIIRAVRPSKDCASTVACSRSAQRLS